MREPEMFTNAQVRILETIARSLGARDERERIIDLLKELLGYGDEDWDECVCAIIASIKRENK